MLKHIATVSLFPVVFACVGAVVWHTNTSTPRLLRTCSGPGLIHVGAARVDTGGQIVICQKG